MKWRTRDHSPPIKMRDPATPRRSGAPTPIEGDPRRSSLGSWPHTAGRAVLFALSRLLRFEVRSLRQPDLSLRSIPDAATWRFAHAGRGSGQCFFIGLSIVAWPGSCAWSRAHSQLRFESCPLMHGSCRLNASSVRSEFCVCEFLVLSRFAVSGDLGPVGSTSVARHCHKARRVAPSSRCPVSPGSASCLLSPLRRAMPAFVRVLPLPLLEFCCLRGS